MPRISALPGVSATNYRRSELHAEERIWVEKNCYVDIWIELVHALGLDPHPMLPFTLAIDFEGDQWTFFKPPHDELRTLYGIDVQELNVWRPLVEHAVEHLSAGKFISTEADAYWLPDTSGTDYRTQHTKTTIVLADLDLEARRLGYFHNAGYFEVEGEDLAHLLRLDAPPDPAFMPLFAELVRVDGLRRRTDQELTTLSQQLLARHLARAPSSNPIERFQRRFDHELALLQQRGLAHYHAWAFATLRQLGAGTELASEYLRWLGRKRSLDTRAAADPFAVLSTECKGLILKTARAVNSRRAVDFTASFQILSRAWQDGMGAARRLSEAY